MREIDISTNSPHYFYSKSVGTVNENLNFDIRVLRVKPPPPPISKTPAIDEPRGQATRCTHTAFAISTRSQDRGLSNSSNITR